MKYKTVKFSIIAISTMEKHFINRMEQTKAVALRDMENQL